MADGQLVYVIDEDSAVRNSLRVLLNEHGYIVRVFANEEAMLGAPGLEKVGCMVLDIRLPGNDGLGVQGRLAEIGLRIPIILVTGHADVRTAVSAMKSGAFDFLEKPFEPELILATIAKAVAVRDEARVREEWDQAIQKRIATLTSREHEVLDFLVKGMTNKEVGEELGISERTVEVHKARIMRKMEAKNSVHLVRLAHGLQSPIQIKECD